MPITYNIPEADHPRGLIAIIDIGSNSVRMVVYHALKRVPLPLFNEKYMCALGKGLARTGKLNPEGARQAERALARFLLMAQRLEVDSLNILATAALRDAVDGAAFVRQMERQFGVHIRVVSGNEEAALAAQGVLASFNEPFGLSADLGGGSMELATVERSEIGATASCRLGSLRMLDAGDGSRHAIQALIARELAAVPWLAQVRPPAIYAIGGGFRALAKLHIAKTHYPLDLVHEYAMPRRAATQWLERLLSMSPAEIADLPGLSAKRAATIVPTALVLQHLLQVSGAKEVRFSVSGIREGFFYGLLGPRIRREDPLIGSANDLAALIGRRGQYAQELHGWMSPLFAQEPLAWGRLRLALCTLSELAWAIDPNFRAPWAYQRIVQSSLKGMDHQERLMLALSLYHRYRTRGPGSQQPEVKLLEPRARLWARCVGLAANLAFQLSGGRAGNLHHARLRFHDGLAQLTLDDEARPLRTEIVEKRLSGLSDALRELKKAQH